MFDLDAFIAESEGGAAGADSGRPEQRSPASISAGTAIAIRLIPPATFPGMVAREYVGRSRQILRHWRGSWYTWTGTHYREVDEDDLKTTVRRWLESSHCYDKDGEPRAWCPTLRSTAEVMGAIQADPAVHMPSHADRATPGIPFSNGVLQLDGTLAPHNPSVMRTWCVGAEYSPDAACPEWERFLASALAPDQVLLAQEWAGYVISGDLRAQKLMLLHGAGRAGKGTFTAVLSALLGDSVAGSNPDRILDRFGLEPIHQARLVLMSDVRWSDKTSRRMLDLVRSISGSDPQDVNRKNRTAIKNVSLPCRFQFSSNDLPMFSDDSGATLSRFLLLGWVRSMEGKEDKQLLDRLLLELPGIASWALSGYRRYLERGSFTEPARARADRADLRLDVEPVRVWCQEQVHADPAGWESVDDLFEAYESWSGSDDSAAKKWFARRVKAALPYASGERRYVTRKVDPFDKDSPTRRRQVRGYAGISLTAPEPEAEPKPEQTGIF